MADWTEFFGPELVTKDGKKPTQELLAGKNAVGIYFSAHWCPPCRAFTPMLGTTYEDLVEAHNDVEIVFTSSDSDLGSFEEYYGEMPFLALPYENRNAKTALGTKYGVRGIPTLVFVNAQGEIITKDGREWVDEAMGDVDALYKKLTSQ